MLPKIKITRHKQDTTQTLGICSVIIGNIPLFSSICLERGWRNNEQNVSCIPLGEYEVVLEYSPKFETMLWEIKGVIDRSECKFHTANYWHDLNGCIALGSEVGDINSDGYNDVLHSGDTMKSFHKALHRYKKAILIIT